MTRGRTIGLLCKPFCPPGKRREFSPAKRLGICALANNNPARRKWLDRLLLGRYIGSSRPSDLSL